MNTFHSMILLLILATSPAQADRHSDHEEARRLRISGEILPFSEVLQKAEQAGIDTLLEAELEQENQHWVYEVEGVSNTNQLIELTIDAQTGRIIKREHQKRRNREAD